VTSNELSRECGILRHGGVQAIGKEQERSMKMQIGFIGLGRMGAPMVLNLIKAGHTLTVHDIRRESAQELLKKGASWADSPCDAARGKGIVMTSLPGPREVEAVVLGHDGVKDGIPAGATYVDLSTSSPALIRHISQELGKRGVNVLDAPVSGGVVGAVNATLSIIVGGEEAVFQHVKTVLEAIGDKPVYCGPSGAGMVCKLCNNLMVFILQAGIAECLTLGVKAGVKLETVVEVINKSTGSSRRLKEMGERVLGHRNEWLQPGKGFALTLAAKDLNLAMELGREFSVPLEVGALATQRIIEAIGRGWSAYPTEMAMLLQEERTGVRLEYH
jgi:3-hydroxyisobutyrate dehydrogenase